MNSCFTLSLVTGLSVCDTSENATANLAWTDIALPDPVFIGDTLWAESEILGLRESASNPNVGIVEHANPWSQPARRDRDRVPADVHDLPPVRARGDERPLPRGLRMDWRV